LQNVVKREETHVRFGHFILVAKRIDEAREERKRL
jgi:hypothetical protein